MFVSTQWASQISQNSANGEAGFTSTLTVSGPIVSGAVVGVLWKSCQLLLEKKKEDTSEEEYFWALCPQIWHPRRHVQGQGVPLCRLLRVLASDLLVKRKS